jgi:hypothetical protein
VSEDLQPESDDSLGRIFITQLLRLLEGSYFATYIPHHHQSYYYLTPLLSTITTFFFRNNSLQFLPDHSPQLLDSRSLSIVDLTSIDMAAQSAKSFTSIPILSLASARNPDTKPAFLEELLDALLHVGFLYLSDTGIDPVLVAKVCEQTRLFFDERVLPKEEKLKIEMVHKPSFLGYSRVS